MATLRRVSRAQKVAQVNTITPANVASTNTFTVTINNKSITYTSAGTTVAGVTAGLVALLQATDIPEFQEATWTDSTTHVTMTSPEGVPITQTSSAAGGTATLTTATTTAASGPWHWAGTANWSTGANPGASDTVFIDNLDEPILYGLDQNTITLTALHIAASMVADIGLPKENSLGYFEYRDDYLKISATTLTIGRGEGNGSGRIKINVGSVQTAVEVEKTGSPAEFGLAAVLLVGTHASNTLEVKEGSVDVAPFGAESSTLDVLRNSRGTVRCSAGVTLSGCDIHSLAGSVLVHTTVANWTQIGGEGTLRGASEIGTLLDVRGGRFFYESTEAAGEVAISGPGVVDCSRDLSPRTFNVLTLKPGGTGGAGELFDPFETVTITAFTRGAGVQALQGR